MLAAAALTAFAANAQRPDRPADGQGGPGGRRGGFMQDLTDEQKACIEAANCAKPERGAGPAAGEKPAEGGKPDREDDDCMKKAFESCGIEMPERPRRPTGWEGNRPPEPAKDE
jgi:hypothetical protein